MESNKRKSAALDYDELGHDLPVDEQTKRPRTERKNKQTSQARVDPTYGQRSAFPGLDSYSAYATEDDDLEYGDDIEALQYLQSVRDEAAGIPTLLVAPKSQDDRNSGPDRSIYEDGTGDARGFYSEGAYVGVAEQTNTLNSASTEGILCDTQAMYFQSLLQRFHRLHDQLNGRPPQPIIDGLSSNHPSYMSNSREDLRSWRWRLFNTDPQPTQIAVMDKSTVFKLLRLILTNNGALGGKTLISSRLSRWIWGLLAKVPVSGELVSEEVGLIREIGKRAVWLGVEMRGVDIRELYNEKDAEKDDDDVAVDFDLDDGDDGDAEIPANGSRIIGPVMPSDEGARSDIANLGNDATETEADIVLPVTFSSRAEAFLAQQTVVPTSRIPEEGEVDDDDNDDDEETRIKAMKERLLASLDDTSDNTAKAENVEFAAEEAAGPGCHEADLDNAKITVDMIITIAGEVYGQRDLLEFRAEWD